MPDQPPVGALHEGANFTEVRWTASDGSNMVARLTATVRGPRASIVGRLRSRRHREARRALAAWLDAALLNHADRNAPGEP